MEDSERMGQAGMGGVREDEFGDAELLDAPQALEFGCIEQLPGEPVERVIRPENDEPMHRIADALCAGLIDWVVSQFELGRSSRMDPSGSYSVS